VACTIAMNVELRKIGEAARYLSLSSIVPNRILSKDSYVAEYLTASASISRKCGSSAMRRERSSMHSMRSGIATPMSLPPGDRADAR
jgi:hypothetical protein